MINYAYILKQKEKDNPSPFCRASYLFSNVGTLVYCYGRSLRFPQLRKAYEGEMKLALGDIIMQARMAELEEYVELDIKPQMLELPNDPDKYEIEYHLGHISIDSGWYLQTYELNYIEQILRTSNIICKILNWNFEEVSHLGFQHVMERFEQFEKEGWE